LKMKLEMKW